MTALDQVVVLILYAALAAVVGSLARNWWEAIAAPPANSRRIKVVSALLLYLLGGSKVALWSLVVWVMISPWALCVVPVAGYWGARVNLLPWLTDRMSRKHQPKRLH